MSDEADDFMSQPGGGDPFSEKSHRKTFEEVINEIESYLSTSHYTVYHWYYASQYTEGQAQSARQFMNLEKGGYVTINFDHPEEEESQRYTLVEQNFVRCDRRVDPKTSKDEQKMLHLQLNHFASPRDGKVLILVRRIKDTDKMEYYLKQLMNISCEKTNGDLQQAHREQAMYSFRLGHVKVLIATTKLGVRGVNIDGVTDLVLWDLPDKLSEYIFCLGRVGLVDNKAISTAFYGGHDFRRILDQKMISFLEKNNQTVPPAFVEACQQAREGEEWSDVFQAWGADDDTAGAGNAGSGEEDSARGESAGEN